MVDGMSVVVNVMLYLTSVMSVVRGMRRVGEVCETCMCLARGRVGAEGVRG